MLSLGKRMKRYEAVSNHCLSIKTPVIIRVDGRAFHTYTKGMNKPFDYELMNAMLMAAQATAREMQGFKIGYVQSDEVTFCLSDLDSIESDCWFGYKLSKLVSISAALMTAYFNRLMENDKIAVFDSRAFNVPIDEIANVLLWRAKDWERNSLQMYAREFFSHKELHCKNTADIHEMLHSIGKNWATDLTPMQKNGSMFLNRGGHFHTIDRFKPTYADIDELVNEVMAS